MGIGEEIKNFYIKDDKAYTEDNICVQNLFVRGIPLQIKNEEVLEYFARFGEVVKMELNEDKHKRRRNLKSGSICFADAQVAAKVLQKKRHMLQSKPLLLRACDSWDQPGAYKSTEDEDLGACGGVAGSQLPPLGIQNLNDDCLEIIAKQLDLHDQVRLALTCTRFSGIIETCSKVKHKILSFEHFEDMTLWEIREFFLVAGNSVETIVDLPQNNRNRILELIAKNCPNVKNICLDRNKISSKVLRKLITNMKKVTKLQMRNCSLNDNSLVMMQKLPELEKLTLSKNDELTGYNLSKLSTVRELDIQGCRNIETSHFIDMVKSMKDLKSLNVKKCKSLSTRAFEDLEKYCLNLEVLRMTYHDMSYESVARLPTLKRLELNADSVAVTDSLFKALSQQSSQLEYLKIMARNCINLERAAHIAQLPKLKSLILVRNKDLTDSCLRKFSELDQLEEIVLRGSIHITDCGLLHLIRRCTKLRSVNIQRCPNISNEFIFDVVELLRERHRSHSAHHKREAVVFAVLGTGISEFVLNNSRCRNASSLIQLSFHCAFNMDEDDYEYLDAEDFDAYDEVDVEDHDEIELVKDLDDDGQALHMYDYSDMDDDEYQEAKSTFGY